MTPDTAAALRVGLTGGIASGKTTVAAMFGDRGAVVLDADRIAHDAVLPGGAAYDDVVTAFGDGILRENREIDRARLGEIVFADAEARKRLEGIVHPRVRAAVARCVRAVESSTSGPGVVIVDAALLVETGTYREYDRLVVARCPRETQRRRLTLRDGLSTDAATRRLDAQAPLADKVAVADYVIDTDVALSRTRAQADDVWRLLLEDVDAKRRGRALAVRRRPG